MSEVINNYSRTKALLNFHQSGAEFVQLESKQGATYKLPDSPEAVARFGVSAAILGYSLGQVVDNQATLFDGGGESFILKTPAIDHIYLPDYFGEEGILASDRCHERTTGGLILYRRAIAYDISDAALFNELINKANSKDIEKWGLLGEVAIFRRTFLEKLILHYPLAI